MFLSGNVLVPLPSPVQLAWAFGAGLCSCSLSLGQIATAPSHERSRLSQASSPSLRGRSLMLRSSLSLAKARTHRDKLFPFTQRISHRWSSADDHNRVDVNLRNSPTSQPSLKIFISSLYGVSVFYAFIRSSFMRPISFAKRPGEAAEKILSRLADSCVRYTKALFFHSVSESPSYPGFCVCVFFIKSSCFGNGNSGRGNKTIPKLTSFLTSHLPSCHLF